MRLQNALSELKSKKVDCESDLVKFKKLVVKFETISTKLDNKMGVLAEVQQSLGMTLSTFRTASNE